MAAIDLGTTVPTNEKGAQLGNSNYNQRSSDEADVYIEQLKELFGEPPGSSSFDTSYHNHEFGTYKTIVYRYSDESEIQVEYAEQIEEDTPYEWTELSKRKLKELGYNEH